LPASALYNAPSFITYNKSYFKTTAFLHSTKIITEDISIHLSQISSDVFFVDTSTATSNININFISDYFPNEGLEIIIKDIGNNANTNNIIITLDSSLIENESSYTIDVNGASARFIMDENNILFKI
jgi:hypothetical protein